jgi:heptosyltransferase-3
VQILSHLGKGAHVALIRLRSLGDCVLTTPAIHLLKSHRPDLRIGVAVEPRFSAVFENNPDIDDILPPSLTAVRKFAPSLCLNLHGGTRSTVLTLSSGAQHRAGFAHYRYSNAYNIRIPTAQQILCLSRKVHTAEHVASAIFYLGVPKSDIPRARLFAKPVHSSRPYAVIHPFASDPAKTWPAERFLELAGHLREHAEMDPIFIGSPSDNLAAFHPFRTSALPLSETKSLLAGASLFVGNDSGPAHMAAAFGLPVIVLFSNSDHVVWAPWKTQAETIVAAGGMESVPSARVFQAIEKLRVKA